MKTIPHAQLKENPAAIREICDILDEGGLVCLPCGRSYRILADLRDPKAVTQLMQSKRRTAKAPSLVFVADVKMLSDVAEEVPDTAHALATRLWPGRLTLLFEASEKLPRKVVKQLAKANGKIGARIPVDPVAREIVSAFRRPVLVSSANRQKKAGADSAAQVRKNFGNRIAIFVDAGDLPDGEVSTVVDIKDGHPVIKRPGALSEREILGNETA